MKKILLALAFIGCMFAAHAQEKPSTGDLYDGLTRPLTFNRVTPPYALEVDAYLTDRIILSLTGRERILWGTTTGHFHAQFGLGVKFIIH